MKYTVEITALVSDFFDFEANSMNEALDKAEEAFNNGEIKPADMTAKKYCYRLHCVGDENNTYDDENEEDNEDIDAHGFDDGTHEEMEDDIDDSTFDDDIVGGCCDMED